MTSLIQRARALLERLGQLSPTCREVTQLQSQALDQRLPGLPRIGLRIHRMLCGRCRRYGDQLQRLRLFVQTHSVRVDGAVPDALSPEARQRLQRALREAAK